MVGTLAGLDTGQWSQPSLCNGWSVQIAAAHIVNGAEQTKARFVGRMAANGFRFNTMIDHDARATGASPPDQIVARLRATTTTTNHPPAPVAAMLGEVVVHGEDIRRPLGLPHQPHPEAISACLGMFAAANFPVGGKKRIAGLRLVADDVGWSQGTGAEVSGPGLALLLAMTGRVAGLDGLEGEGVATLRNRLTG